MGERVKTAAIAKCTRPSKSDETILMLCLELSQLLPIVKKSGETYFEAAFSSIMPAIFSLLSAASVKGAHKFYTRTNHIGEGINNTILQRRNEASPRCLGIYETDRCLEFSVSAMIEVVVGSCAHLIPTDDEFTRTRDTTDGKRL